MIAVPAKRPKPSFESPSAPPSVGKMSAAMTLKRKMTEMDWAISSSPAPITGAVAAMADPPQMDEPTPINVEMREGIFMARYRINARISDVAIVETMIGRDCAPSLRISAKFMPKPSSTTAHCRIFLEVKLIPGWKESFLLIKSASTIPIRIANTGPPTTGRSLPRKNAGKAITRHKIIPLQFVFKNFIPLPTFKTNNKYIYYYTGFINNLKLYIFI